MEKKELIAIVMTDIEIAILDGMIYASSAFTKYIAHTLFCILG